MNVHRSVPDSMIVRRRSLLRPLRAGNYCVAIVTFWLCCGANFCAADDTCENPATAEPHAVAPQPEPAADAESNVHTVAKLNLEKRKKASAAMAAIGGIAILGIGVIAVTMVWARRLRLLARDLGPAQTTTGNDFWFLKPPKTMVSDLESTDSHRPRHSPPRNDSTDKNP